MQAVFNPSPAATVLRFAGGRSYMMRSEKRGGPAPNHRASAPRPPKRRRRRAGFFYKLLTLLLLLTVWPVGLMLLWRRRLRWGVGTKLLTSVVTLAACIVLIGFALTVNTGNAQYTAVQDSINGFLDSAADTLIDAGGVVGEKTEQVAQGASEFSEALWMRSKLLLSDGIDAGVQLTQRFKGSMNGLLAKLDADNEDEPKASPVETESPEANADPDKATDAPEIVVNTDASELPVYLPDVTPDAAEAAVAMQGLLTRDGTLVEGRPAATVKPSAEPTPTATLEPLVFTVKPASEAAVYYNGSGKYYHMTSACGSMKTAVQHTLSEALEEGKLPCSRCGTPDETVLEASIVWVDEDEVAHLSDECEAFSGLWSLVAAAEAQKNGLTGCKECSADLYLRAIAAELDVVLQTPAAPTEIPTVEPTEKPTKAPTPKPTATPTVKPSIKPEETPAEDTDDAVSAAELSSDAPVEKASVKSTKKSTATPTEAATAEPTQAPTETPTEAPTKKPTEAPTRLPTAEPTQAPTEIPTAEPTQAPTEAPASETVSPAATLKPAGEATVYHSSNGEWYHTFNRCSGMTGGNAYTLAECAENFKCCNACGAPKAELIGQECLWKDEKNICHTSDECPAFEGLYQLILLDDAMTHGYIACSECNADAYLVHEAVVTYNQILPVITPAS